MKKIYHLFSIILCLSLVIIFASCGNNVSDNQSAEGDNTVYKVECEKSNYYTINKITTSATSGTNVVVELTSNYPAYEIIGCTFNDNDCTKTSTDEEEIQKYSFVMPQSNVKIKILYCWKDIYVSGYNNFLSFDEENNYTTNSAFGDSSYNNDENWGTPLILNFNTDAGFMTVANISSFSSNENVIPSSAIVLKNTLSQNSNNIIGGRIIVDRSKIKAGSTQIILRVKSDNNNYYDAIIVAKITVK